MKRKFNLQNLTLGQTNALQITDKIKNEIHCSYKFLVNKVLVQSERVDYEDAVFAAKNCGWSWNKKASLCARENIKFCRNKKILINVLKFYGFNRLQIHNAIKNLKKLP